MEPGKTSPIQFSSYLENRGYRLEAGSALFLKRLFLDSWAQPGFHKFWQVWNPVYGFFLFRLYCALGGAQRRVVSTLAVFLFCGAFLHDLPLTLITGHPSVVCTTAFSFWAVVALFARCSSSLLHLAAWPRSIHVGLNIVLIIGGLLLGARVQGILI